MLSRVLALSLCLILLAPICCPSDGPATATGATVPPQEEPKAIHVQEEAASLNAQEGPSSPLPLSEEEERSLSSRAEEPGPEVSGGALSNLHLTYAVIALAAIVLVLLIK